MALILDEATKSRTKSMQLQSLDYAKELSDQLKKHAVTLEGIYNELQQHVLAEVQKEEVYNKIYLKVEGRNKWYAKAEVGGTYENPIVCFSNQC